MTDYTALADRLVRLGVIKAEHSATHTHYALDGMAYTNAERIVNDGRVVLALMEKCHKRGYVGSFPNADDVAIIFTDRDEPYDVCEGKNESLAVAICEACCEALEAK